MMKYFCYFSLISVLFGCIETQSSKGYKEESKKTYAIPKTDIKVDSNTVFSAFGNPLPPKEFAGNERKDKLEAAILNFKRDPEDLNNIIWMGRWMGYNGLYYEAIKAFSSGLEKYPTSHKLLRHRGEYYIIIRQFDLAVEDLQRAAFYSRPAINETEKNGLSSRYERPISNYKFNIYFFLGAAHYLNGSYDKAISSFKKCLAYCDNDDLLVRASDWFYLTYRKLGNEKAAEELLVPITKKLKVKENVDYLNRIMVYKGVYNEEKVLAYAKNKDKSLTPILAYGIANSYILKGNVERASQIYELMLLNKSWETLEYIAAEVELKSLQRL
ncbi:MAG: hypothetical protein JXR03_07640 [Cyclobacteriaceae bacterium]